jgi:hypothetical protein
MRTHTAKEHCQELTKFMYAPPKKGGQLCITSRLMKRMSAESRQFLMQFAYMKAITAPLLQQTNIMFKTRDFPLVAVDAMESQFEFNEQARTKANDSISFSFEEHLIVSCRTTLLRYAVAYHEDIAHKSHLKKVKGGAFIENKICFWDRPLMFGQEKNIPLGRGGAGPGNYVWTLCDHPNG